MTNIETVVSYIAHLTNAEIGLWYLAIGVIAETLTTKYATPGERAGGVVNIGMGAFFIAFLLPPGWNPAVAVFVAPTGRFIGKWAGELIDVFRLRLARSRYGGTSEEGWAESPGAKPGNR
jgi:hypothetical protein